MPVYQIECGLGGIVGRCSCLEGRGVLLERREGVSDVLQGGEDRAAILFSRLHVGCLRGALLVQQCPAGEHGYRQCRTQPPEARAGHEHLVDRQRRAADIGGQLDVWQPVCNRNPDLRTGGVHVFLGLQHVRTLRHQFRRQADRQFLWQMQAGQVELVGRSAARIAAGQYRQQVAQLG